VRKLLNYILKDLQKGLEPQRKKPQSLIDYKDKSFRAEKLLDLEKVVKVLERWVYLNML
jgi:hypothetical protein